MERYRTTIILVVVLAVLVGAALFLQSPSSTTDTGATTTPTPTTNLFGASTSDPITAIDIISGTKRVSVSQDVTGTTWSLVEPIKGPADTYAVGNLADQLKTLEAIQTITGTKDLTLYGLDKPPLQISIKIGGSKPVNPTLLVGKTTPDGSNYYVKLKDKDDTYIVANSSIEPMRTWLDAPPKAQPTATTMPLTVLPPDTPTVPRSPAPSTVTTTNTTTGTGTASPPITSTTTLSTTPEASPTK